ncbi:hypothetical protein [Polynucleobacter sp. Fuers-14]|uniref:hypothetical protein n=1 Tax=Polynucleobacter sp. Fuers-14 TaxID=1758364 RepID=UPI001C0B1BD1|nr:hypothetical protein [Polynucleobacter sp. Fuers-14]MBU3640988.1 hypothetical protein [Polynucleobacter sp. Fuers-14]
MGFFAPLIFSVMLLGFLAIFGQESKFAAINTTSAQMQSNGQSFLAYRNAVMTYQQNNPGFAGVVPVAQITSIGGAFSSSFLGQVNNVVIATGVRNTRVVICYGPFTQSVAEQASIAANNDASFGISNGTTWTSAAVGASRVSMPLATTITSGNIVSVIELDL